MSVSDTIPPSVTVDALKDATIKDTPVEPITANGVHPDGAHTHTNGIISATEPTVEPVVIIADPQPADVTATLLPKSNSSDNITPKNDTNNNPAPSNQPSTDHTPTTSEPVNEEKKKDEEVVIVEDASNTVQESNGEQGNSIAIDEVNLEEITPITQNELTYTQQEQMQTQLSHNDNEQQLSSSSSSNIAGAPSSPSVGNPPFTHSRADSNNSNSNSSLGGNPSYNNNIVANNEIRTSARNLRNSVLGIEEEEVDEHGVKHRKIRRKERSHSRIVLHHKKNLIGETIYKGHQSWVLMLNIQIGIRNAVGRGHSRSTVSAPKSPLAADGSVSTPKSPIEFLGPNNFDNIDEFYASPKVLNFPPEGSANTIPHNTGPFKFKDYCPHAFRFLRHRFGIDTADYMVSLCNTQKNGENALRELPTPGKSGSLFFFSHDMRFILKTIPKSEAKLLRSLLPSYVDHIANDENTLLPKFFGLHRVKPHRGRQVRFLVMSNIFQTRKTIHERYDLKGSTLGRAASEDEKKKESVTFKDLDFIEKKIKIQIGGEKRIALLEQLHRDVKFLAKLNIMDYSYLVGVHNIEKEDDYSAPPSPQSSHVLLPKAGSHDLNHEYFQSIFQENDGGLRGLDEHSIYTGKIYYMGIIDILMLYSIRKKVEHTYKTLRYGHETQISSISPNDYATRFYDFVAASIT